MGKEKINCNDDKYLEILEFKKILDDIIRVSDLFLNKVDPDKVQTLKYLSSNDLAIFFDGHMNFSDVFEVMNSSKLCADVLLQGYSDGLFTNMRNIDFHVDDLLCDGISLLPLIKDFLQLLKDKTPELVNKVIKIRNFIVRNLEFVSKINDTSNDQSKIASKDLFMDGIILSKENNDSNLLIILCGTLIANEERINELEKLVSSIPVISDCDKKKNQYKDIYKINIEDVSTFEEVVSLSKEVGIDFYKEHFSVFKSDKELFLKNISILRKKCIPLSLILNDSSAFLLEDLENRLNLISQYNIPLDVLFNLFKNPISDLSYFSKLDLLIENSSLTVKNISSFSNKKMNIMIFYRLLGITNYNFKLVSFTELEINELLVKNSTMLANNMDYNINSLYDEYMVDDVTLEFDGIKVSRPKVLRNLSLGNDALFINEFYTDLEKDTILSCLYRKEKH